MRRVGKESYASKHRYIHWYSWKWFEDSYEIGSKRLFRARRYTVPFSPDVDDKRERFIEGIIKKYRREGN